MKYKVLMTGAGAPGGPGIMKCLLRLEYIDLFIADASEDASGKYLLPEKFFHISKANDPDFSQSIFDLCIQKGINVVFPLVTKELLRLSENRKIFEKNGIRIIVSDYDSLSIAVNKCRLYEHLSNHQIELPKFKIVKHYHEFMDAVSSIGFPEKPFCVKPGFSNGSRGVRIVDNCIDTFDLLFNYKPDSLYMNFHELDAILKEKKIPELLISEVLPGDEVTIDTIVDNGKIQILLPRKRLRTMGGISVQGEFFYDEKLVNYIERILSSLKLAGPIGIQCKQNEEGNYRVLEINPRIQGTSAAAMGLNINLPELSVRTALDLVNEYQHKDQIKWGTKFFRFYDEVFY